MAKVVYHVDDAKMACRLIAPVLTQGIPDIELRQFQRAGDLIKDLQELGAQGQFPYMIFSDYNMPVMTGLELLQWLKRHPKFHTIPTVMVTAEIEDKDQQECLKFGAMDYVSKPVNPDMLEKVLVKRSKLLVNLEEAWHLDKDFSEECLDMVAEGHRYLQALNEESSKNLYRVLHTIKGCANSLQFPVLGSFVHQIEALLTAVQQGNLYEAKPVKDLMLKCLSYIEDQCDRIQNQKLMDAPSDELIKGIQLVEANVASGWKMGGTGATATVVKDKGPAENGVVSKTSSSVRITNEKLDELQDYIKRILQVRTKMSRFGGELKSEFHDEDFPNDLMGMIDELNQDAMNVFDFFISLRVVSAKRLKLFCDRVLTQTRTQLEKNAKLNFEFDEDLEVDQTVVECLENGLTHMIRNSVDHGMESEEVRIEAGKDPVGLIKIKVARVDDDKITLEYEDDGGGINADRLKAAIEKKSVVAKDVLDKMSEKQIYELVFLDGLSSKDEVSEVSGRGVGLGAVKQSIEDLGGKIGVDSSPGKGTSFSIEIPRIFRL